jgi:hypothetical protein
MKALAEKPVEPVACLRGDCRQGYRDGIEAERGGRLDER